MKEMITDWIQQITAEGPLPENVKAIYIGLFEGEENYTIHFLGSAEFDPEADDWACQMDGDYFPKNRYLVTNVPTSDEWQQLENNVIEVIRPLRSEGILAQSKHVAIGFDSGDLTMIENA